MEHVLNNILTTFAVDLVDHFQIAFKNMALMLWPDHMQESYFVVRWIFCPTYHGVCERSNIYDYYNLKPELQPTDHHQQIVISLCVFLNINN